MATKYADDLALVQALREGRTGAWNRFVEHYSRVVLNLLRPWCETTCRRPRMNYQCILQVLREGQHDRQRETCDEAMDMYLFTFQALRSRVVKYQGKSSLATYISALMRFIHHDFFRQKFHRITVPVALQDLPAREQAIYKLMRRGRESFEIAQELGLTEEQARAGQELVRATLRRRGEEWEHLDGWLAANQPPLALVQEDADSELTTARDLPVDDRPPEQAEILDRLRQTFNRLPPAYQRILELRFARDYSVEQIGELGRRLPALGVADGKEVYRVIDRAVVRWLELVREGYRQELAGEVDLKVVKDVLPDFFGLALFRPVPENEAERAVKEG